MREQNDSKINVNNYYDLKPMKLNYFWYVINWVFHPDSNITKRIINEHPFNENVPQMRFPPINENDYSSPQLSNNIDNNINISSSHRDTPTFSPNITTITSIFPTLFPQEIKDINLQIKIIHQKSIYLSKIMMENYLA